MRELGYMDGASGTEKNVREQVSQKLKGWNEADGENQEFILETG